jgi:phosphate starvation-inducible PhoH-like protein
MTKKPTSSPIATSSPLQKFINATTASHTKPQFDRIVISARNPSQKKYIKSLQTNVVSIALGPAGCGKTYLPTLMALDDLVMERIRKIVIIRPSVEVEGENEVGALPGDIIGKYGPQIKPVTDTLVKHIGLSKLNQLLFAEVIEIVPVAFIRGRSFDDAWILVDEAQNLSKTAMKAILTRIGENCHMSVAGDIDQSDRLQNNGLEDLLDRLERKEQDSIGLIKFTKSDVERSDTVKSVLDLYED